jgi:hypothetical protein
VNQRNLGRKVDGRHPRESLVGKGYGLATDRTGRKDIVLSIDCLTRTAVRGGGGMGILVGFQKRTMIVDGG